MFTLRFSVSPREYNVLNAVALRRFNASLEALATNNPWVAYAICRAYSLAQAEKGPPDVSVNGRELATAEMDGEFATKALAQYYAERLIPLPNTCDVEVTIKDLSSDKVILSFVAKPV